MKLTKQEALEKIEELKSYVENLDKEEEWVKIDYSVIPKEIFEKYGAKPFEIMKRKMRNNKDKVWNNISWTDAKEEAKKIGYRLPSIQEMLVLLDYYKKEYLDNADIYHEEFLGIKEISFNEDVPYEWIDAPSPSIRGANWSNGSGDGAFALYLDWGAGRAGNFVGFRCVRAV